MPRVLLVQLPIPRQNFGRKTGNIPLGAACLKQAAKDLPGVHVDVLPESLASYLGDAALIQLLSENQPDVLGMTVFSWNLLRSLHVAEKLKAAHAPRIIFGGPEITPDNVAARSAYVDACVCGEGEAAFRRLLGGRGGRHAGSAADIFRWAESPYLNGMLEPELEDLMLLETQRGCPYRCGFCFYNKSHAGLVFADEECLLRAIAWAVERGIGEIYMLDPSLNARPRLKPLLAAIARLTGGRPIRLFSEIRAEAVDTEMADLLAAVGFDWFEIGLQSTNPKALAIMKRPTSLKRFLRGARLLKARGITPSIDLIVGLPGDDLQGFMRSVDFVVDHDLVDDVQIFPLAVLPGTEFRRRSRALGLNYESSPPYTVTATDSFSPEDFLLAYDYAETRLDAVFFPLPDLDTSWRLESICDFEKAVDVFVQLAGRDYASKLMLNRERPLSEIQRLAQRLTQPYQILVGPAASDPAYLKEVLAVATRANPFTPFEVVFFEPEEYPRTRDLLAHVHLQRPHFLDGDLRFLFPKPGNRAVLFTLVSADPQVRFQGDMERQVHWWRLPRLPHVSELERFCELDGVLLDSRVSSAEICAWQDRHAGTAAEKFHICFSDVLLQRRWLLLTRADEYTEAAMNRVV